MSKDAKKEEKKEVKPKTVNDMNITELKATAYDILAGIELAQNQLREVNNLIRARANNDDRRKA